MAEPNPPSNWKLATERMAVRASRVVLSDTFMGVPVIVDPTLPVNYAFFENPDGSRVAMTLTVK
jgi:hypothetical protein